MEVVVPSTFWTSPRFAEHRKRPGLHRVAVEMCRVTQECGSTSGCTMRVGTWAAAIGMSIKRFVWHVGQLVADGCAVWADGVFAWADWVWPASVSAEQASVVAVGPRLAGYPGDQVSALDSPHSGVISLHNEADSPHNAAHVEIRPARPDSADSVLTQNQIQNQDQFQSGCTDSVETESVQPVQPDKRVCDLESVSARTIVDRLVAEGMEREKATSRVEEFGEVRCDEALQAVDYASKPVRRRLGWIVDYLVYRRQAPRRLVAARAPMSMVILAEVSGGVGSMSSVEQIQREFDAMEILRIEEATCRKGIAS